MTPSHAQPPKLSLIPACLASLALLAMLLPSARADGYYKAPSPFHMAPDPDALSTVLPRFGPVGIGIDFRQPDFTMVIKNVEPDSPAAATGELKAGQIIASINGKTLKEIDPRIFLGNLITEAEATDGKMRLMVKDDAEAPSREIVVSLPVLGPYSPTWPLNCRKSDAIVRKFADRLAEINRAEWGAPLFLLSTGEDKDLAVVRRWFSGSKPQERYIPWEVGYAGPAYCEYYLRTGDKTVLPYIQSMADYLKRTIYNGSWMGRGGASFGYMAGGHMNAAGVHCVNFLLLAKECGVDVDDHTLQTSLKQFFRFAGRGVVAYGDGVPEGGMVDNGRNAGLAFAMQSAANLHPAGEASIYARARDNTAMKSFYSTSWLFHGHTGGGIGELWRGASMGLVADKMPTPYRTFMDGRRWMYELARTHDGRFGWSSTWNVSYTDMAGSGKGWGNYIPLIYTVPRKQLRMFGAPKTKYSQTYAIPDQPWGNEADNVFYSLDAGALPGGRQHDTRKEILETHASMPLGNWLTNPERTDEELLLYARHIEAGIRAGVANAITRQGHDHLIVALLSDADPRARHTGAHAIAGQFKGMPLPKERLTPEMVEALAKMVENPQEAWWGAQEAMLALGMAEPEQILPHVDRLLYWLDHEEWWLRRTAMIALVPVCTNAQEYRRILPAMGKMVLKNQRASGVPLSGVAAALAAAPAEVRRFGLEVLGEAYRQFPEALDAPGGQNMKPGADYLLNMVASNLSAIPGGFDTLFAASKARTPDEVLPHLPLYLNADMDQFGPTLKQEFAPIMRNVVIWKYVGENLQALLKELEEKNPGRATEGFVGLNEKLGVTDYTWHPWGPARDKIAWHYYSYDPKETKEWGGVGNRYRPISWPEGADDWMMPGFDAAKAGWKTGRAPFAAVDGELRPMMADCNAPVGICDCDQPPNTLWEKEVLLMRTELELPAVRDGYAYRLLAGGRSHVNTGDGAAVWINGKKSEGRNPQDPSLAPGGRNTGGVPKGITIAGDLRNAFDGSKVTLAACGFMTIARNGKKQNYTSYWFEEMKIPTFGDAEFFKALKVTPLKTREWYESQSEDDLFTFGGVFKPSMAAGVVGAWEPVGILREGDEFIDPDNTNGMRNNGLATLQLNDDGTTNQRLTWHSDGRIMDLLAGEVRTFEVRMVQGQPYLFVQTSANPKWGDNLVVYKVK